MRKIVIGLMLASLFIAGCGQDRVIGDKQYETYGIFNKEQVRDPNIEYRLIFGNVVWGILLCESIIAPIYFFGFSIYEPVRAIN